MTAEELQATIAGALGASHWFLAPGASIRVAHVPFRTERWEVFRGHLLDPRQTRQERTFECWDVTLRFPGEPEEQPLIALRHDAAERVLHVIRRIRVLAWEPYEQARQVIEAREAEKWLAELVGGIDLARNDTGELRRQLEHYLHLAVVGVSRLPITSLESPLPAFSLGRLGYFASATGGLSPMHDPDALLQRALRARMPLDRKARLLELSLRALPPDEVGRFTGRFLERARGFDPLSDELPALLRTLFNQLALSPYTSFVPNLASFILRLGELGDELGDELGPDLAIDAFSYYLRHLVRHLTAFDLVTFHNLGANYPDALALDAFLRAYLRLLQEHPGLFGDEPGEDAERARRLRRRALRQAVLLRRRYEGHAVPDAPTSPGENRRVVPGFDLVPDEQILQPHRRRRRLFADAPTEALLGGKARRILERGLEDLERPSELQELGMAVFLDRPLGVFKQRGEVDRTPLLSYESLSVCIVERRLGELRDAGFLDSAATIRLQQACQSLRRTGVPAAEFSRGTRPGVVALEDANQAAPDFFFLRTTRASLQALLSHYDLQPLKERDASIHEWLCAGRDVLLIRSRFAGAGGPLLVARDFEGRPRLELAADHAAEPAEYVEWMGAEQLKHGLRLTAVAGQGREQPPVTLPPRLQPS